MEKIFIWSGIIKNRSKWGVKTNISTHTHVCLINFKTLRFFFSFTHHTHIHTRTDWIMYNIYLFWRDDNNNKKKNIIKNSVIVVFDDIMSDTCVYVTYIHTKYEIKWYEMIEDWRETKRKGVYTCGSLLYFYFVIYI